MVDHRKYLAGMYALGRDILVCYAPFLIILMAFTSFRFISPELSERIHYTIMPGFDRSIFGGLPTIWLQHLLWHGQVMWYDYVLYAVYVSHYLFPVALAWVVFKRYRQEYLRLASTYMLVTFTAFIFFILYPTAPPWLASQQGYIPHITRIAGAIFSSVGVHNFSHLYSSYVPNPVAALPSLHAAYSVLFVLFINQLFGKRWAALSLLYPFCIMFGVVYMGEHYFLDICAGTMLAITGYLLVPVFLKRVEPNVYRLAMKTSFLAPLIPGDDLHERPADFAD